MSILWNQIYYLVLIFAKKLLLVLVGLFKTLLNTPPPLIFYRYKNQCFYDFVYNPSILEVLNFEFFIF